MLKRWKRKMKKSKLFTPAELKALNEKLEGKLNDRTGIFSGRVKPKLKEMLEWNKNTIKRLLK